MGGSCSCLSCGTKLATPTSSTPLPIYGDIVVESSNGQTSVQTIEEQIEHSKAHWSQVSEFELDANEVVEVSNVEVFRALQSQSKWGTFFVTFGKDGVGELVMDPKFAEGGQAELYDVEIHWNDAWRNEENSRLQVKWVLKVFKKGTLLHPLQLQWPLGMLQEYVEQIEWEHCGNLPKLRFNSEVNRGVLLEDGRFAFLMVKEHEDLRHQIDCLMLTTRKNCCPYSKEYSEAIMYLVAKGMEWLHSCGIVHHDLKASNVLYSKHGGRQAIVVANFECSVGVVGTGFFRAPEILEACKDYSVSNKPELFTKEADVYSYGMLCYEILTGKLPFEDYRHNDFDHVLVGARPKLPEYVDGWMRELLGMCWQANPIDRPSFEVILETLLANSKRCRELQALRQKVEAKQAMGIDTSTKYLREVIS